MSVSIDFTSPPIQWINELFIVIEGIVAGIVRCFRKGSRRGIVQPSDSNFSPSSLEPPESVSPVLPESDQRISLEGLHAGFPQKLFGRGRELKIVHDAWEDAETCILCLVGEGGAGKTALVNYWLNEMLKHDYRDADRVFGWSFKCQGAGEGREASADIFMDKALRFFGDKEPSKGTAEERALRLAGFICGGKTLLILDGLEPLQHPAGELKGGLRDWALDFLLGKLMHSNPGLCIITTQMEVRRLESRTDSSVKKVLLGNLSPEAGISLLEWRGANGRGKDLRMASKEYQGNALSLTLLASYVKTFYKGRIRKRKKIPGETCKNADTFSSHAGRIMKACEKLLKKSSDGKIMQNVLNMLTLFDGPAEPGAIAALRAASIKGLTLNPKINDEKWACALKKLRNLNLLDQKPERAEEDFLNYHPLIRKHFSERFRTDLKKAWKEAHSVLYEHYKALPEKLYGKHFPETLEEMAPLFTAVRHGCAAGRCREVLHDVYWERIKRKNEHYCTSRLGAFGEDSAALANFFQIPWIKPVSGLTGADKIGVLLLAGFNLCALGRPDGAVQPMKAGLEMCIKEKCWRDAAGTAGNISELLLTHGNVKEAVTYAKKGVKFADRSGDDSQRESRRRELADALHKAGKAKKAAKLFRQAEAIRKKRRP